MSFAPNDLVTDQDLFDYEPALRDKFGQTNWQSKRTKALEDWAFPSLKRRGFDPYRLRTRFEPDQAFSYTSSTYADQTSGCQSTTADDLNLATIFATPSTDALYIGSTRQFRGLFVRMLDTVSSAAGVLSVAYFNGSWENLAVDDQTVRVAGKTLSGGGAIKWLLPHDWMTRAVNSSTPYYWVKVTVSAVPTSAKAGQISAIVGSALRVPVTYRTLELIFREAETKANGPWLEKAEFYKGEAAEALEVALQIIGGDFDTDASDEVSETESEQTSDEVSGGGWVLERA